MSDATPIPPGRLDSLAVIDADGPEAGSFLHAQLSNDVTGLAVDGLSRNAMLTPKGRVLATALVLRAGDERYRLVVEAGVREPLIEHLRRFVFRAKVSFGDSTASVLADAEGAYPYWDGARRIRLVDDAVPADSVDDRWLAADVAAGIPRLGPETREQFTAHALGLDRLGALSFRKGCYPGQEVVARTRHLGRGKRHSYLVAADEPLVAGADISGERGPLGRVVMASSDGDQWRAMAVLHESARDTALSVGEKSAVRIVRRYGD